jgi:transcription elongation factor Elf1
MKITQTEIQLETERLAKGKYSGLPAGNWKCPRCKSEKVYCNKTKITARGVKKPQMQCRKCGKYYTVSCATYEQYKKAKKIK